MVRRAADRAADCAKPMVPCATVRERASEAVCGHRARRRLEKECADSKGQVGFKAPADFRGQVDSKGAVARRR